MTKTTFKMAHKTENTNLENLTHYLDNLVNSLTFLPQYTQAKDQEKQ